MIPGSSHSHEFHTDGMSAPDPGNPNVILKFVGTWSDHDPSWEVRMLPNIPNVLPTTPLRPRPSPWGHITSDFSRLLRTDVDL